MIIEAVPAGPLQTNAYLVGDRDEGMVIDPSKDSRNMVLGMAKKYGLKIAYIVDTHGHWDHIADNYELRRDTDARLAIHKLDERMILEPGRHSLPFRITPTKADFHIEEGSGLKLGSLVFRILHTPGHSPGSCCLHEEKERTIFTGDTLFAGTYGRTDFEGGDEKKMRESLRRLSKLPPETKVYPGHGPSTTIGKESWLSSM